MIINLKSISLSSNRLIIKEFFTKFFLFSVLLSNQALADVDIYTPDSNSAKLPFVSDYATEVLGNPWDMDSSEDLANYVTQTDYQATTLNFSGGVLNISNSNPGAGSFFYLVSPAFCGSNPLGRVGQHYPIDTTKYRYLVVRLYSERPAYMRALVNFGCNTFTDYFATPGIRTTQGWNTYYIDLATVTRELTNGYNPAWGSANATGLRIYTALDETPTQVDYVMLTAEPPADRHNVMYDFVPSAANALHSLYVDNDNNPYNGVNDVLLEGANATTSVQVSPAKLFSGEYKIVGIESLEYSSLYLDPWDMENVNDYSAPPGMNIGIQSGALRGTTTAGLNYFFLNNFGKTIDASKFRYLQLDFEIASNTSISINWFSPGGSYMGSSYPTPVVGRNTYNIDLGAIGSWAGTVGSIQVGIDAGVSFALHSASLRIDGYGPPQPVGSVFESPANLKVNFPPLLTLLQPDEEGGVDFATETLGNPWNMDDAGDIPITVNLTTAQIFPVQSIGGLFGNFFYGINVVTADPTTYRDPIQTSLSVFNQPSKYIDTTRFKNLTYKLRIDRAQDINEGSVVRVIWHTAGNSLTNFYNSEDIIVGDGWRSYTQDMNDIILESGSHPAGSYPSNPWSVGAVDIFRVDAHEFYEATPYSFDYIRMTADDEANTRFALNYKVNDLDTSLGSVSVNFYLNSQESTTGGTLVGTTASAASNFYYLDTTGIAEGKYWVVAEINDGFNSYKRLSSGRLHITRGVSQDTEVPVLNVENPTSGSSLYDTVNVAGYALDRRQLAGIEVKVNNTLIDFVKPDRYHEGAYNTYSNYTEGSNAGFLKTVSLISLPPGSHNLELIAYDTAGNTTSSGNIPFTKLGGADVAPYSPANPNLSGAIDVKSPGSVSPTIPALPTTNMSVKYNAKKKSLDIKVTGSQSCSSVKIVAAEKSADVSALSSKVSRSKSKTGTSSLTFNAKVTRGVKKIKGGPATFFGVLCDDRLSSSVKKLNRIKLESKNMKHASWVKYVIKGLK